MFMVSSNVFIPNLSSFILLSTPDISYKFTLMLSSSIISVVRRVLPSFEILKFSKENALIGVRRPGHQIHRLSDNPGT